MGKKNKSKIVSFAPYSTPKKKKNINSITLWIVFILIIIVSLVCVCLFTDVFDIKNIDVKGINVAYVSDSFDSIQDGETLEVAKFDTYMAEDGMAYYTIDEIIKMSGISQGNNIFKENINTAISNIEKAPYVKSVNITRKFPNVITINVEERILKSFVDYVGSYICMDENGYCVNVINKSDRITNQPIVLGLIPKDVVKGFVLGEMLDVDDPIKLQRVLNLLSLIEKNELAIQIETIDVTNADEVIVKLLGRNINVNFGDMGNINLKIQFLPEILNDIGNKEGTILMNTDEDNLKPRFFEKI